MDEIVQVEGPKVSMILILGETGAGKSFFIDSLVPGSVKIGHHAASCTQKPQLVEVSVDGNTCFLIDTPGFNDTYRSDTQVLREIALMLAVQRELGVKLCHVLYLHDILPNRVTGQSKRQLKMLTKICGEDHYKDVTLVTTRWPTSSEEQKRTGCAIREGDLRRMFWNDMIKGGSRMVRFLGTKENATAILRSVLKRDPIELVIQTEMVAGKTLEQTSAGSYIMKQTREEEVIQRRLSEKVKDNPKDQDLRERLEELSQKLRQRQEDEQKLKEDVIGGVREGIKDKLEEESKAGRRPSLRTIISWFIGLSNLAVGIVGDVFNN